MDNGKPTVRATVHIEITNAGQSITIEGDVTGIDLGIAAWHLNRAGNQMADAAAVREADRTGGLAIAQSIPAALARRD